MCTIHDDAQPVFAPFSFLSLFLLILLSFSTCSSCIIGVLLSTMCLSSQRIRIAQRDVDRGCATKVSFSPRGNLQTSNYLSGGSWRKRSSHIRESQRMAVQRIASQAAGIHRAQPPRQSIEIKRLGIRPCSCLTLANIGRVRFLGADEEAVQ